VPRRSAASVARLGGGCALYGRSVSRVLFDGARAGWQPRGWQRSRRRRWRQRGGRGSGGMNLCAGTTVSHLHSMCCACCSFSCYLFCPWRLPRSIFFGWQAPRLFVALCAFLNTIQHRLWHPPLYKYACIVMRNKSHACGFGQPGFCKRVGSRVFVRRWGGHHAVTALRRDPSARRSSGAPPAALMPVVSSTREHSMK